MIIIFHKSRMSSVFQCINISPTDVPCIGPVMILGYFFLADMQLDVIDISFYNKIECRSTPPPPSWDKFFMYISR